MDKRWLAKALDTSVESLLVGVDPEYDAARAVSSPDRPIVVKHLPSQLEGGADVLPMAEASVFEGWRPELLPDLLEAIEHLADLISRS